MLELPLTIPAEDALAWCRGRGLVVTSQRELGGRPGSHHWHLRRPGHPGTLELSEWQGRAWVKVHPLREGTWATRFAHDPANTVAQDDARGEQRPAQRPRPPEVPA